VHTVFYDSVLYKLTYLNPCMSDSAYVVWCSDSGGLMLANGGVLAPQNSRRHVSVYADENAAPSMLPEQNEEYVSMPLPEVIDSENQLQPGRWNENRLSGVIGPFLLT